MKQLDPEEVSNTTIDQFSLSSQQSIEMYRKFFLNVEDHAQIHQNDTDSLKRHGIRVLNSKQLDQLACKGYGKSEARLLRIERGGSVVNYQVIIGNFLMVVLLLHVDRTAPQQHEIISEGSFGTVLRLRYSKASFVAKRIYFNIKYSSIEVVDNPEAIFYLNHCIKQAINEFGMANLCSAIGVGPQTLRPFGFQIICFKDCVEFYMQRCETSGLKSFNPDRLKYCVRKMHSYNLVHKDIKPANILYSKGVDDFILLDFGLSHAIKERIGEKSQTYHQGTARFMSAEMRSIGWNRVGKIDLYLNDTHSLKLTIEEMSNKKYWRKPVKKSQSISSKLNDQPFYEFIKSLFMAYNREPINERPEIPHDTRITQYFPEICSIQRASPPFWDHSLILKSTGISIQLGTYLQACDKEDKQVIKLIKMIKRAPTNILQMNERLHYSKRLKLIQQQFKIQRQQVENLADQIKLLVELYAVNAILLKTQDCEIMYDRLKERNTQFNNRFDSLVLFFELVLRILKRVYHSEIIEKLQTIDTQYKKTALEVCGLVLFYQNEYMEALKFFNKLGLNDQVVLYQKVEVLQYYNGIEFTVDFLKQKLKRLDSHKQPQQWRFSLEIYVNQLIKYGELKQATVYCKQGRQKTTSVFERSVYNSVLSILYQKSNCFEAALSVSSEYKALINQLQPQFGQCSLQSEILLIRSYRALKQYNKAFEAIDNLLKNPRLGKEDPQLITVLYEKAQCMYELQKFHDAIEITEKALYYVKYLYGERSTMTVSALLRLGGSWAAMARTESNRIKIGEYVKKAIEIFQQAQEIIAKGRHKLNANVCAIAISLSSCYIDFPQFRDQKQAKNLLLPVLQYSQKNPKDQVSIKGIVLLAICQKIIHQQKSSFELLEQALTIVQSKEILNIQIETIICFHLFQLKRFDRLRKCILLIKDVMETKPMHERHLKQVFKLAEYFFKQKQYQLALACTQLCQCKQCLFISAHSLYYLKRKDQSLQLMKKCFEIDTPFSSNLIEACAYRLMCGLHKDRGQIHLAHKNLNEAIDSFIQQYQMNKKDPKLAQEIGDLLMYLKRNEQAFEWLIKAFLVFPPSDKASIATRLMNCCRLLGKYQTVLSLAKTQQIHPLIKFKNVVFVAVDSQHFRTLYRALSIIIKSGKFESTQIPFLDELNKLLKINQLQLTREVLLLVLHGRLGPIFKLIDSLNFTQQGLLTHASLRFLNLVKTVHKKLLMINNSRAEPQIRLLASLKTKLLEQLQINDAIV